MQMLCSDADALQRVYPTSYLNKTGRCVTEHEDKDDDDHDERDVLFVSAVDAARVAV